LRQTQNWTPIKGQFCAPIDTGFQEFLRPVVIQALGDPLAPAKRRDRFLAAQAFQHDADLLLGRILLAGRRADVLDDLFRRRFPYPGFRWCGPSVLSHLRSFERLR
jgi:hypothetical protein